MLRRHNRLRLVVIPYVLPAALALLARLLPLLSRLARRLCDISSISSLIKTAHFKVYATGRRPALQLKHHLPIDHHRQKTNVETARRCSTLEAYPGWDRSSSVLAIGCVVCFKKALILRNDFTPGSTENTRFPGLHGQGCLSQRIKCCQCHTRNALALDEPFKL